MISLLLLLAASMEKPIFYSIAEHNMSLMLPLENFSCWNRSQDKSVTYIISIAFTSKDNRFFVSSITQHKEFDDREYRGVINSVAKIPVGEKDVKFILRPKNNNEVSFEYTIANDNLSGHFFHKEWNIDLICDKMPSGFGAYGFWDEQLEGAAK